MSQSYNSPFTGNVIQPTDVSFIALDVPAGVTTPLEWSAYAVTDFVAARITNITPLGANAVVNLPPATQASVGTDILVYNDSGIDFTLADYDGTELSAMPHGIYRYFYLVDNSTDAGVWQSALFGSGTAILPVAEVAGFGIDTANGLINTAYPMSVSGTPPTITAASRATFYVYTGGTISTPVLPSAASVGNDFFVVLRNSGTGALTFQRTGTDTIDGSTTLLLNIGDSCVLVSGGGGNYWYTFGKGRNTEFSYNLLTKDVGLVSIPGTTYTLTTTEASNTIQVYTDTGHTRVSSLKIFLPNTVQTYYVSNQTGVSSYDLQFQLVGSGSGTGSVITVSNGQQVNIFSDGSGLYNANTVPISGSASYLNLSDGTASSPTLNFISDTGTGIYRAASSTLGITSNGTGIFQCGPSGVTVVGTGSFSGGVSGGAF